ncbi:MAG: hypothetical protein WCY70_06475 [Methanoculleus sp.]
MIAVSIVPAFVMPDSIIARATAMFMGLSASAFPPAHAHAVYSVRSSLQAVKMSFIAGTAAWFAWTVFVHVKESAALGLSNLLFGVPAVPSVPWQDMDPLVIALPLSTTALLVGWVLDHHEATADAEESAGAA